MVEHGRRRGALRVRHGRRGARVAPLRVERILAFARLRAALSRGARRRVSRRGRRRGAARDGWSRGAARQGPHLRRGGGGRCAARRTRVVVSPALGRDPRRAARTRRRSRARRDGGRHRARGRLRLFRAPRDRRDLCRRSQARRQRAAAQRAAPCSSTVRFASSPILLPPQRPSVSGAGRRVCSSWGLSADSARKALALGSARRAGAPAGRSFRSGCTPVRRAPCR